mmetsp:Transcript_7879/g.25735  ORF Transcript_7879/g.25735 Transcript_7879/m.25735 type:complete len:280 (+) Transcript_7879:2296-3135(+)
MLRMQGRTRLRRRIRKHCVVDHHRLAAALEQAALDPEAPFFDVGGAAAAGRRLGGLPSGLRPTGDPSHGPALRPPRLAARRAARKCLAAGPAVRFAEPAWSDARREQERRGSRGDARLAAPRCGGVVEARRLGRRAAPRAGRRRGRVRDWTRRQEPQRERTPSGFRPAHRRLHVAICGGGPRRGGNRRARGHSRRRLRVRGHRFLRLPPSSKGRPRLRAPSTTRRPPPHARIPVPAAKHKGRTQGFGRRGRGRLDPRHRGRGRPEPRRFAPRGSHVTVT